MPCKQWPDAVESDCPYGKKLKLQQERAVIPERHGLTGYLFVTPLGRSWGTGWDRRCSGPYGVGMRPGIHHRDRGPAAAVAERVSGCREPDPQDAIAAAPAALDPERSRGEIGHRLGREALSEAERRPYRTPSGMGPKNRRM
jgi:hypothetical protein